MQNSNDLKIADVSNTLCDVDATEETQKLMRFLQEQYTEEKAELNAKIADLILQENSAKDAYQKINRLYEAIEKYDSITELTPEVLSDFVDRIEVGEHLKGTKEQKIDVFFVGVGLMDTL